MRVTEGGILSGFTELEAKLKELEVVMATKIGARAVRKGATLIKEHFKSAAPVGPTPQGASTGNGSPHAKITNSVRVKKGRGTSPNNITYLPFISGRAFHARFLERGTIHMAPKPFAVAAFESSAHQALEAIRLELMRGIERGS